MSPKTQPQMWSQVATAELKTVKGVCLDIDDTLSSAGKLTASAYQSLESLKKAGYAVVPITGRPAGWCDHFARFWPVDAVVGENGAFTFYMNQGVRRAVYTQSGEASPESAKQKLSELHRQIVKHFPHARVASDQAYREFDLAIDICEDVSPWPSQDVQALLDLCKKAGAHAKLSSIHVNIWFGNYDKYSGFRQALSQGILPAISEQEWLFIGDSPNDEPLFKQFKFSVGVANLSRYLDRLQYPPRWLTHSESGAGFSEMAATLVGLKASQN